MYFNQGKFTLQFIFETDIGEQKIIDFISNLAGRKNILDSQLL